MGIRRRNLGYLSAEPELIRFDAPVRDECGDHLVHVHAYAQAGGIRIVYHGLIGGLAEKPYEFDRAVDVKHGPLFSWRARRTARSFVRLIQRRKHERALAQRTIERMKERI